MASIYGRLAAALVLSGLTTAHGTEASSTEFTVETKIPLGDISGRIDHLAVDLLRHRLYVAELGNDSIGVVDLEAGDSRIFVNVPDAHQIAVVDLPRKQTVAEWPTKNLKSNYPLALDESGHVLAVFRSPARIGVFDADRGTLLSSVETCGDSDDLFIDSKRARVYVICGEGFVDSLSLNRGQLVRVGRIATAGGARTGLFVPETDRLYVAVRSGFGRLTAVWVLRPQ